MRYLLILNYLYLAVALYGCSVDNSHLTMHNYTEDQIGEHVVLQAPSTDMYVTFAEVESIYLNTQACTGYGDRGVVPTVVFRDLVAYARFGSWGFYTTGAGTMLDGHIYVNTNMVSPFERSKRTDVETLRHEFIHHLLYNNNIPWHDRDDDPRKVTAFKDCGQGVNTYN